jgi:hypothetical protein
MVSMYLDAVHEIAPRQAADEIYYALLKAIRDTGINPQIEYWVRDKIREGLDLSKEKLPPC